MIAGDRIKIEVHVSFGFQDPHGGPVGSRNEVVSLRRGIKRSEEHTSELQSLGESRMPSSA